MAQRELRRYSLTEYGECDVQIPGGAIGEVAHVEFDASAQLCLITDVNPNHDPQPVRFTMVPTGGLFESVHAIYVGSARYVDTTVHVFLDVNPARVAAEQGRG